MRVIPRAPRVPQAVVDAAKNVARARRAGAGVPPAERRKGIRRAKGRLRVAMEKWRKAYPAAYAAVVADLRRRAAVEEEKAA